MELPPRQTECLWWHSEYSLTSIRPTQLFHTSQPEQSLWKSCTIKYLKWCSYTLIYRKAETHSASFQMVIADFLKVGWVSWSIGQHQHSLRGKPFAVKNWEPLDKSTRCIIHKIIVWVTHAFLLQCQNTDSHVFTMPLITWGISEWYTNIGFILNVPDGLPSSSSVSWSFATLKPMEDLNRWCTSYLHFYPVKPSFIHIKN